MTTSASVSLDDPPATAAPAPDAHLAGEIAALAELDLAALRARWRRLTRRPAPEHIGRSLLLRLVAYRIQAQAQASGDLDRDTVRYLDAVHAEQQRRRREGSTGTVPSVPAVPDPRRGRLKPGTLLVREHGGRVHRVMAMAGGFAYEGATYQSLSEIARLITGTSWNGPRFFGLRERMRASQRKRGGEGAQIASTPAEGGRP